MRLEHKSQPGPGVLQLDQCLKEAGPGMMSSQQGNKTLMEGNEG